MNNNNEKRVKAKGNTTNIIDFVKVKNKNIPRRSLKVNKRLTFEEMCEQARKETAEMLLDE